MTHSVSRIFSDYQYPTRKNSKKADSPYGAGVDIETKESLAHRGDMGIKACAIRLTAARYTAGFQKQKEFAAACGVTVTSYNSQETGAQFPNRKVMAYLFKAHRIDFNFLMNGDFAQLPGDVQEALFENLVRANNEWDRKRS